MKVEVRNEAVATLEEIAATLHRQNGWRSHAANALEGYVEYVSREGLSYRLDIYGLAEEVVDGVAVGNLDCAEFHDVRASMEWNDLVWARNEKGEHVALHF